MVTIVEGLLLGIISSLAAAWIIYLRGRARLRLRFRNILSFIVKVAKQVELDNFSPQYIVAVDRNQWRRWLHPRRSHWASCRRVRSL